jgi:hypothetical protein
MRKLFTTMVSVLISLVTTVLCLSQTRVHAAHATPLFHATREYRDATHYLASMLMYHAALDPTQKMFMERLVKSSHQLYAAALNSPTDNAFRQTWAEVRKLVQDFPWMLDTLPPNVNQRLLPQARQFLLAFQTLAEQVALCEHFSWHNQHITSNISHASPPRQIVVFRREFSPNNPCRTLSWPPTRQPAGRMPFYRPTLSPSQWQLDQTEKRTRSSTAIRREKGTLGAHLSRLVHP